MIDTDRNILFGKCLWTSEALEPKRLKHVTPPESTFNTTKSHQSAKKRLEALKPTRLKHVAAPWQKMIQDKKI